MLHALTTFRIRESWLVLGPSGRELAIRGALELEANLRQSGGGLVCVVSRGLSDVVDAALLARAPELGPLETFWREWAGRTIGRHAEVLRRRLARGTHAIPEEGLLAAATVRGPVDGPIDGPLASLSEEASVATFDCLGPHPGDRLVVIGAEEPPPLFDFFARLAHCEPLAATPITLLAVGRRASLEDTFGALA